MIVLKSDRANCLGCEYAVSAHRGTDCDVWPVEYIATYVLVFTVYNSGDSKE